jgi:tRNA (mo5U34)-methyltransferase
MPTLTDAAREFRARLAAIRQGHPQVGWYPYDTLANTAHLDRLLGADSFGRLHHLLEGGRCADIGTGDGDLAFLLEHLGYAVDPVDNTASSNHGDQGFETLRAALGSRLTLHNLDLDRTISYPHDDYQLVFLLGVLYHLKNPFLVLDELARRSRYLILSTRIMRRLPSSSKNLSDQSVAYLVDADELNDDDSNFWIFTETSLARLLRRCHWKLEHRVTLNSNSKSDPVSADRDERIFCLARSHYALKHLDRLTGWRPAEGSAGWRWVEPRFAFQIDDPGMSAKPCRLDLIVYLPEHWFGGGSSVTLQLEANGQTLQPLTWTSGGQQRLRLELPTSRSGTWQCSGRVTHRGIAPEALLGLGLVIGRCELE